MAIRINAGDDVKRGDLWYVDPFQIIKKEDLRGRKDPPTDEDIINMAMSFLEHGQQQPVKCRRNAQNQLVQTSGFTRNEAARLIRQGFDSPDGTFHQDPEFKLQVTISDVNDEQAFIDNVVENAHRKQTSPIDDAYNHRCMRERYGKTDADIARLYRYSQQKVANLRRLLLLPDPVQQLIHDGKMPVQAGLDLLDLPDDKRDEAIAAVSEDDGTVKGSKVRELVRDHNLEESENGHASENGHVKTKTMTRSVREVRKYFEQWVDCEDSPVLARFSKDMIDFIQGKKSVKAMDNAMRRLVE